MPPKGAIKLQGWHRAAGVAATLFVVLLGTTGIALNHAAYFNLGARSVSLPAVLRWYGIEPPQATQAVKLSDRWVVLFGNQLYLDDQPLAHASRLNGAAQINERSYIAADDYLLILAGDGTLIERLTPVLGLPGGIRAVGVIGGRTIAVDTTTGRYEFDAATARWRQRPTAAALPDRYQAPPPALVENLAANYVADAISLEHLLLDIHSGRFLGRYGPLLMDAAAVLMLLLAASGVWLYAKR